MKNTKKSPALGNEDCTDSITIAARPYSPRFQSFANENENLFEVCQTFRLLLLEQKVRQVFQTCQTCRFRTLVVNSNTPEMCEMLLLYTGCPRNLCPVCLKIMTKQQKVLTIFLYDAALQMFNLSFGSMNDVQKTKFTR